MSYVSHNHPDPPRDGPMLGNCCHCGADIHAPAGADIVDYLDHLPVSGHCSICRAPFGECCPDYKCSGCGERTCPGCAPAAHDGRWLCRTCRAIGESNTHVHPVFRGILNDVLRTAGGYRG